MEWSKNDKRALMETSGRFFSYDEVRLKIEAWCAYQDRCLAEVEERLKGFELSTDEKERLLSHLKKLNYVDDERYVASFVSGKFRNKRWGRLKIRQMLLLKKIPRDLIQAHLYSMEEEDYRNCIVALIEKKNALLSKEKDLWKKKGKIVHYLASRGFEIDLVQEEMRKIQF